jgi:uncharacterized lipoprotein
MYRIVAAAIVTIAVSGCAFTPQAITIRPDVQVASSQVGKSRDVPVNVVDERPRKALGTVGVGNVGADISIEGDLVNAIQTALLDGLSRLSFKPRGSAGGNKSELRIEVRNLDYRIIRGLFSGTLQVDAGLKAVCVRDGLRPYEKLYLGEFKESVQVIQGPDANAGYINAAISSSINAMLADQSLLSCLAL